MGNKTTGRNWTRRSIEEIFDDMFAKKGGSGPTPTGLGEIYAIVPRGALYTGNYGSGFKGLGYFYRTFALENPDETIEDYPIYKESPIDPIKYLFFRVSSNVSPTNLIPGLHWAGFSLGDSQVICAPTSDASSQDVYQMTYQGSEIVTIQSSNISYSYGPTETGETLTVSGGRFTRGTANFLNDDVLSNCPLYGGEYDVFLIDFDNTSTPADASDILAIINTIHKRYSQYGITHFNNVITI